MGLILPWTKSLLAFKIKVCDRGCRLVTFFICYDEHTPGFPEVSELSQLFWGEPCFEVVRTFDE